MAKKKAAAAKKNQDADPETPQDAPPADQSPQPPESKEKPAKKKAAAGNVTVKLSVPRCCCCDPDRQPTRRMTELRRLPKEDRAFIRSFHEQLKEQEAELVIHGRKKPLQFRVDGPSTDFDAALFILQQARTQFQEAAA